MARASVIDDVPASRKPAQYTWSFPGAPVDVRLSLDMVERLRNDLNRDGEPAAKQGLLLGRMVGGATEIVDFTLLPEPPSAAAPAKQTSGAQALVGYFRTTSDAVLKLNSEDLRLAETVLSNPHQVFLLIQSGPPNAPHALNATFFFWDEGRMCGDFPFLEFPLDRALLGAAERRRIESAAQDGPAAAAELAFEPARRSAPAPRLHPRGRSLKPVVFVTLIVFGSAGAAAALKLFPAWFRVAKSSAPLTPAPAPQTVLGLQAERQNGDLKLTWNRQSPAVLGALSGVLSIEEAVARRSLTLDPAQLRSGNILYAPVSDQVQIQLTVFGAQGSASESAIVILPQGRAPEVRTLARKVAPPAPELETAAVLPNAPPQPQRKQYNPPAAGLDGVSAPRPLAMEPPPALSMKPEGPALAPPAIEGALKPLQVKPPAKPSPQVAPPAPVVYSPPTVAQRVLPPFPTTLRPLMAGLKTKTVAVTVYIDEKGNVLKAEPLRDPKERTPDVMFANAVNAARLWKFTPGRLGSRAVPSQMVVRFEFKLDQ